MRLSATTMSTTITITTSTTTITSAAAVIITITTATTRTRCSQSWGVETAKKFTEDGLRAALAALEDDGENYGAVLRAKGIVAASDGDVDPL